MYPFQDGLFAPLNRWYVLAWSDEIGRTPIERWLMDAPVALYRTEGGDAVCVDGRCPHHLYPLGNSTVVGDNIRCGYHGLEFAPSGECVASPFLQTIPAACRIKSYAVAERWKWLWVWPGDPSLADESLIPDHASIGLQGEGRVAIQGLRLEVDARYQLLNDNLLDLQHLEVLHPKHIGGAGIGRAREETDHGPDWVSSRRVLRDMVIPPVMANWFGPGLADREIEMTFRAPGIHTGSDAFSGALSGNRPGVHLGRINVYHAVTPARRNTCHYFSAIGRDFALDDAALDEGMFHALGPVLEEDRQASELIEKALAAGDRPPQEMLFATDKTVVQGRRVLERMMLDEQAGAPGSVPGSATVGQKRVTVVRHPAQVAT